MLISSSRLSRISFKNSAKNMCKILLTFCSDLAKPEFSWTTKLLLPLTKSLLLQKLLAYWENTFGSNLWMIVFQEIQKLRTVNHQVNVIFICQSDIWRQVWSRYLLFDKNRYTCSNLWTKTYSLWLGTLFEFTYPFSFKISVQQCWAAWLTPREGRDSTI